jgi:hypothetical protein
MYWFARRFQRSVYAWFAQSNGDLACPKQCDGDYVCPGPCVGISLGLLWFQSDLSDPTSQGLHVDKYFRVVEAVTLRGTWNDPDALFVGFKAGDNNADHGHLDIGTFVFDALNQRWAVDLGADDYDLPGYFTYREGKRWTYYRLRAEGHNTLVLNPSDKPDQDPVAKARITRFGSEPEKSFAIANLTPAYGQKLERGIALMNRESIVVQDEFLPQKRIELWWFMHTPARVHLSEDGRTALLEKDSARLWCGIASSSEARFSVMDAKPLPSSPNPIGQDQNQGIQKLAIHINDLPPSVPFTLSVAMIPLTLSQEPPTEPPPVTPLAKW